MVALWKRIIGRAKKMAHSPPHIGPKTDSSGYTSEKIANYDYQETVDDEDENPTVSESGSTNYTDSPEYQAPVCMTLLLYLQRMTLIASF